MMRSLYSGVSGLKVHQTKMDVIGNNIANVNTVGFKSSTVNFSDILYQTTQSASGANEATGIAGKNAKQIGLGANLASITTNMTVSGGSQRTDNPFDLMINGDAFFVVNQGGQNYFTKAGAFKIDANGTLCTPAGASVMGWQVNSDGTDIVKNVVSPLNIMSEENLYADPKATAELNVTGNIDKNDPQLAEASGVPLSMSFYDKLGNSYNIQLAIKETTTEGAYDITVTDVVDGKNQSIFAQIDEAATASAGKKQYKATDISKITLGGEEFEFQVDKDTGKVTLKADKSIPLIFDSVSGKFKSVGNNGAQVDPQTGNGTLDLLVGDSISWVSASTSSGYYNDSTSKFSAMRIDFSSLTQFSTSDKCSLEPHKGTLKNKSKTISNASDANTPADSTGAGRKVGEMSGISIDDSGKIYGSYDNGSVKLLGQIAVATFANPSGLEAVGNNMFKTTANSGDFNGIGQDPTEGGNSLATGVLEMSNVDLSEEFTSMITTQRGFQANSRIITTSDTLLEELINLKR